MIQDDMGITLAAKCAPDPAVLDAIEGAGIVAVELYTSAAILSDMELAVGACTNRGIAYVVHAPNDGPGFGPVIEFARAVGAKLVVMHDIYYSDELPGIVEALAGAGIRGCLENVSTILEPLRFVRRYGAQGMGICLDLEHIQIECAGVYEEEFLNLIPRASHIHLTGYQAGHQSGAGLWHSHLHHNARHAMYMLGLIRRAGYRGWVVSEARNSYQTHEEFKALAGFFRAWLDGVDRG